MTLVTVESASPLSTAQQKELAKQLESSIGKDLEIVYKVDPAVIGGLRITTPETVVDMSLAARLNELTQALQN